MSLLKSFPKSKYACHLFAVAFTFFILPSASYADDRDDFFRAVQMDRADLVQPLLNKGFDPNTAEPHRGNTGLIIAMHEGSMKVFELLVSTKGIDLDKRAQNGNTALMMAVWKSNLPAVKILLDRGAKVNQTGWTALHYAAATGNNEVVKMLLDKKAVVDAPAPNKTTPLMMAARAGHIKTVKLLLDNGADVRLRNEWDMNAIDFARDNNHTEIETGLQSRLDKIEKMQAQKK